MRYPSSISRLLVTGAALVLLAACGGASNSDKAEATVPVQENAADLKPPVILPDTTVNQKLYVKNSSSAKSIYPDVKGIKLIKNVWAHPAGLFANMDGTEYLMAYQDESKDKHSFGCFEIGYINEPMPFAPQKTKETSFKTESGIGLGMPLDSVEHIKGKSYEKKELVDNTIILTYTISDTVNSAFLQRYHTQEYSMEITLKEDKVSKIYFGFNYPGYLE